VIGSACGAWMVTVAASSTSASATAAVKNANATDVWQVLVTMFDVALRAQHVYDFFGDLERSSFRRD